MDAPRVLNFLFPAGKEGYLVSTHVPQISRCSYNFGSTHILLLQLTSLPLLTYSCIHHRKWLPFWSLSAFIFLFLSTSWSCIFLMLCKSVWKVSPLPLQHGMHSPGRSWERKSWQATKEMDLFSPWRGRINCHPDKGALIWVQKASVSGPCYHFWGSSKCSTKAALFLTLWSLQVRCYFWCCDWRGPGRIVMAGGYQDFIPPWRCQPLQL